MSKDNRLRERFMVVGDDGVCHSGLLIEPHQYAITDYYLGLLPEKREPDLPIAYTDSGKINVNSQYTRGFNACLDKMEASIRGG